MRADPRFADLMRRVGFVNSKPDRAAPAYPASMVPEDTGYRLVPDPVLIRLTPPLPDLLGELR